MAHQTHRYLELFSNKHSIIVQSTNNRPTHDRPRAQAFSTDRSGKTGPSRRTSHQGGTAAHGRPESACDGAHGAAAFAAEGRRPCLPGRAQTWGPDAVSRG